MNERNRGFKKLISFIAAFLLACCIMPVRAVNAENEKYSGIYFQTLSVEFGSLQMGDGYSLDNLEGTSTLTLAELGVKLPEYSSPVEGLNFIGWYDADGNQVTENTRFCDIGKPSGYTVCIYAHYDKSVLASDYTYVNRENKIVTERKVSLFEPGTSLKDAFAKAAEYVPEDMTSGNGKTFDHWERNRIYSDSITMNNQGAYPTEFYADYQEGKTVYVNKTYVDADGKQMYPSDAGYDRGECIVVPDGATYGQVYETLRNEPIPEMYPGLRFASWSMSAMPPDPLGPTGENDPVAEYIIVSMQAQYENALIHFILHRGPIVLEEGYDEASTIEQFRLAEIGESIPLPTSLPGAEQIIWGSGNGGSTYTVDRNGENVIYGTYTDRVFTDVEQSSPYNDAIYWAFVNNITKGRTDSLFAPNEGCTRGQFVTFLWRLAGEPEPRGTVTFNDMVPESSPYYKAILWAAENGITQGYSGNVFKSSEVCSRGSALTFLYRAAGSPEVSGSADFTDMVPADHAYYNAIVWGVENEITLGYKDGTFKPFRACSRGQNVTFLYRTSGKIKF